MKIWFYAFFMAWGMFLSLPCPFPKWDEAARSRMLAVFPLIGVVIGALWGLAAYLMPIIRCPKPIAALVLAALPWAVTGFIHLDGFSDVCDAILSRRDLKTRQKILKDPNCGAFAVISLVLLILAQYALFLTAKLEKSSLIVLMLIPVATRACAGIAVLRLRPMATSQYSAMKSREPRLELVPIILLIAAVFAPIAVFGLKGLAPLAASGVYAIMTWRGFRALDGMNGDISGYALTLGELAGVVALVLIK